MTLVLWYDVITPGTTASLTVPQAHQCQAWPKCSLVSNSDGWAQMLPPPPRFAVRKQRRGSLGNMLEGLDQAAAPGSSHHIPPPGTATATRAKALRTAGQCVQLQVPRPRPSHPRHSKPGVRGTVSVSDQGARGPQGRLQGAGLWAVLLPELLTGWWGREQSLKCGWITKEQSVGKEEQRGRRCQGLRGREGAGDAPEPRVPPRVPGRGTS